MDLWTVKQAAEIAHCSQATIITHVKRGNLKKYPMGGNHTRRYYVDLDEVNRVVGKTYVEKKRRGLPENLITPTEAAAMIWVDVRMITYYAKMGYIQKHYVLGNNRMYMVDRDEVMAQATLGRERYEESLRSPERSERLRRHAESQPRVNGRFAKSEG